MSRRLLAVALLAAGCSSSPQVTQLTFFANLASPTAPSGAALSVAAKDGVVYEGSEAGLRLWKVNKGTDAELLTDITETNGAVTVNPVGWLHRAGNLLYAPGAELRVFDITNAAAPVVVSHQHLGGDLGLVAFGPAFFVSAGGTVSLWDLTDPKTPVLKDTMNPGASALAVTLNGNFVYVRADQRFFVLEVQSGKLVKRGEIIDNTGRVLYANGYVYTGFRGLRSIVDVQDPAAPKFVGDALHPAWADGEDPILLIGNTLFSGGLDLSVWDLSSPLEPVRTYTGLGTNGAAGGVHDLFVDGSTVYSANDNGVTIFTY